MLSGGEPGFHKSRASARASSRDILDTHVYDEIITVSDERRRRFHAAAGARGRLAGRNFVGRQLLRALQVARRLGPGKTVVTVFCDTGERYLTTDLFQAEGICALPRLVIFFFFFFTPLPTREPDIPNGVRNLRGGLVNSDLAVRILVRSQLVLHGLDRRQTRPAARNLRADEGRDGRILGRRRLDPVLKVAHDTIGDRALALTTTSPTMPDEDCDTAIAMARAIGVRHLIVDSNELEIPGYAANPAQPMLSVQDQPVHGLRSKSRELESMRSPTASTSMTSTTTGPE